MIETNLRQRGYVARDKRSKGLCSAGVYTLPLKLHDYSKLCGGGGAHSALLQL